jgi:hypothetical protein
VTVPNAGRAIIADGKLSKYLLNPDNEAGGPKCRFLNRFGFDSEYPHFLRDALHKHIRDNSAEYKGDTEYGAKWAVRGRIQSPDGRNPYVTSIWQIDHGKIAPKLITLIDLGGE